MPEHIQYLLFFTAAPLVLIGSGVVLDVLSKALGSLLKGFTRKNETNPPSNRETRL